jgi:uncharacterized protein (TIGR02246 family)
MAGRTRLLIAGVAAICAAVACGGTSTTTMMQGTAADEAAIRSLPDRYVSAYNARDAAGIAAIMADNYQAVAPDGTIVQGKTGVQKMVGMEMQMNEKMKLDVTLSVTTDFVHWLGADSATIGGTWTATGVPAGQPGKGAWLAVTHKSPDGQWLVTSDLSTPFMESPAETPQASGS